MRELRVYGTEEYVIQLSYEEGGSRGHHGETVEETFRYSYYEEAKAKFDELQRRWDANDLGWNAHVVMVKTIVMNEVLSYFG